jgi:hypothetical protein
MVQYSISIGDGFDEIGTVFNDTAGSAESPCMKGYERDPRRSSDCFHG